MQKIRPKGVVEDDIAFLARAGEVLASSLDYRETLRNVARLVNERLADYCIVYAIEDDDLKRVAWAHPDPEIEPHLEALCRRPLDYGAQETVVKVVQNQTPIIARDVPIQQLERLQREPLQRDAIHLLKPHSYMVVPFIVGGRSVGALTLARSFTDTKYSEVDLPLVEELARRAAYALDHALLYQSATRIQNRLKTLEGSSQLGILYSDSNGRILQANDAFLHMVGYTREDMDMDRIDWLQLTPPEDLAESAIRIEEWRRTGMVKPFDKQYVCKDGSRIWVNLLVTPLHEDHVSYVTLVTDITERKRAEDEVRDINISLEHRVQARTTELRDAYAQLESFSYSVSHDLRAPLRAINMAASLLVEDYGETLEAPALDLIASIKSTVSGMGSLIDDLLQHAQLARVELELSEVDFTLLATSVADVLRHIYPGVDFRVAPGLSLTADARLAKNLLENLMDNAAKYGCEDCPFVEVGSEQGAFFVKDNGIGFEPEYAEKIFGPFERLHGDDKYAGSGIGLANVKRIVDRHGGRIWAQSEPGQGSTFYFTLG